MQSIEKIFSDNEGNHLLVALYFYDESYKQSTLNIPEEFSDVEIVDINIEKMFVDKPIHFSVFFNMSSWLLNEFNRHEDAVFSFICSTDELETNHSDLTPQKFRWDLFDRLFRRASRMVRLNIQDVIVGEDEYQTFARAFYRDKHAPIIHIVAAHLRGKRVD